MAGAYTTADVTSQKMANGIMFRINGDIDHHGATIVREKIDRECLIKQPRNVVLNFGSVGFMDSSGIGLILGRYRNITSMGGKLMVTGMNPTVKKIYDMAGLGKIIQMEEANEFAV
jgi:stage II sporulation protein AA (anti-sigma F factor antagonist)